MEQFNISGIKCDNNKCDYRDDSVKVEDYDKWLNKPCPKCSSNLLTEADYNNVQMLLQTAQMINSMTPEQLEALTKNIDNHQTSQMNIEMDGTGKMKINLKE